MKSLGAFGAILGIAAAGVVALSAFAATPSTTSAQEAACDDADGDGCLFIVKETNVQDELSFSFIYSHDGDGNVFELADGEQAVFPLLDKEVHSITEVLDNDDWVLDDISCTGEGADVAGNLEGGTLEVTRTAEDGEFATVTCTFYNEREADEEPEPTATPEPTEAPQEGPTATPEVEPPPGTISPPATGDAGLSSSLPVAPVAVIAAAVFMAICASATLLQKQR